MVYGVLGQLGICALSFWFTAAVSERVQRGQGQFCGCKASLEKMVMKACWIHFIDLDVCLRACGIEGCSTPSDRTGAV